MSEVLNEMENINEVNEVEEINDVVGLEETTGGSFGTVLKFGAALLAVGAVAYTGVKKVGPKLKEWNTERKIKSLEKTGEFKVVEISKGNIVEVREVECDEEDVEETEE